MTELYQKLYEYREELRNKENKHTPTAIISDDALKSLAKLKPLELDDMLNVKGIGSAFVQKYGLGFLNVILETAKPVKLSMMRKEVADTLKNLQARLTNVNRRNRMLYLSKPQSSKAVDLYGSGDKLIDAVLSYERNASVVLCDGGSEAFNDYKKLIRASNAATRENGNNTLYVGYPFVVGKCGSGKNSFNVVAPLTLIPVKLEDDCGKIMLVGDSSREATYNNAFILCHNKFNGKGSEPLPSCGIDEIVKRDFIKTAVAFYSEQGIKIDGKVSSTLEKFGSYTDKTFPKTGANEYVIKNAAVVGLFPAYSGAMQKDFDDIIESGVMPHSLKTLLENGDEIDDFYGHSVDTIDSFVPLDSEGRIDYINELNVSQERAIERATVEDALVMQGPPGTGKSQTITSMISDSVNKGKNVLIVSQKRAALSVIYSRLGRIARYCMFIDDPKDKDSFYGRLKVMFDSVDRPAPFNSVAYDKAIKSVDSDLALLGDIASKLKSDECGAPMLRIYRENMDNSFKAAERRSMIATDDASVYSRSVCSALLDCGYDEIKASRVYLDDEKLLSTLGEYYLLGEKYPWLVDVKPELSMGAISQLLSELDGIIDLLTQTFGKSKLKKAIKRFVKENFVAYNRKFVKAFAKDPVELYNGIKAYTDFHSAKSAAERLGFCTRLYFGTIYSIHKETGEELIDINKRLFEFVGYAYIDEFENQNRDLITAMNDYSATVTRVCRAIDRKLLLTKDKTLNTLKNTFNTYIADGKRRGDILRAIDGKRRPSPSRFAEKFSFELFRGVRVFLMTPEAVSEILPLENGLFDLLVFDEASQIYIERGIPSIARAKRIVVCGDHKQLRPSSLGDGRVTVDEDEENDAILEEESLLDIARFKFPEVMLSYHYRSKYEELIAFSNAAFYGGKLNISPNPSALRVPPITVHKVNGRWHDRVNEVEAVEVISLIEQHLNDGYNEHLSDTIGVITFNAAQRDCILDMLDRKCAEDSSFAEKYHRELLRRENDEDVGLFVKNIENVQGDERDHIIFSFAYAYNDKGVMSRNFGWLNRLGGENRLNVAISRAKRKIDIVTSIIPTDLKVDDIKSEGVKVLRKYLDYAYCVSNGDKDAAKLVLNSFKNVEYGVMQSGTTKSVDSVSLKNRIKSAIEAKGYVVDMDVGMGGYTIELAVKNLRGDYCLGVECDDGVLDENNNARERDVMRRRFLESRGWNVVRVWSTDFYNNPDKTVSDVLAKAAI